MRSDLHKVAWRRATQSAPSHMLTRALGTPLAPRKWLFVVGCYNSGTTLLSRLLLGHPQISGLTEEGMFLTDRLDMPENHGWTRMWSQCEAEIRARDAAMTDADFDAIRRQWGFWEKGPVDVYLEKSIPNVLRMEALQAAFAPACFVHIVRNGFAVAEGIQRKAQLKRFPNRQHPDRYPIELCAEQWRRSLEVVEEARPRLTNFLEITYENLCAAPEATLGAVEDFVGIQRGGVDVAGEFTIHKTKSAVQDMNARSLAKMKPADRDAILGVCADALTARGYWP
jgi:hypothetical protein